MARYDVIVVGGGPAGSSAARELAAKGARVLMLDRAAFPRDKPCGGGVTTRAAQLLPAGFEAVVEQTVYEARFSYKHRPYSSHRSEEPLAYMTQRRRLDLFLAEQAVAAGATFQDGVRVTGVEPERGGIVIRTQTESHEAAALVGADGANGIVGVAAGLAPRSAAWVALEGNAHDGHRVELWRDAIGVDLGCLPGGYGWLFTKGDHVNIGVGGWQTVGPELRRHLDDTCRHYGVRVETLCNLKGHALPVRRAGASLVSGRIVLVGDAAALVDPLSGEGIHSALLSGTLAGRAVGRLLESGEDLCTYDLTVQAELGHELESAAQLQRLLHKSPRLYLEALKRSPFVWDKLVAFARGDASYHSVRRSFGPLGAALKLAARFMHQPLQ